VAILGTADVRLRTTGLDAFKRDITGAGKAFNVVGRGISDSVNNISAAFDTLAGTAKSAMSFVNVASQFETMSTSLKTIMGSANAAEQSLQWITDFTSKTPYELDQVTQGFIKLQAYGIDATKNLGILGDTAGAMGKSLNDAVEMFADAITGENERLKEFGLRASQTAEKITYAWSEGGKNMTLTANKNAEDITKALQTIFKRFEGGMDTQSKTWSGMMSNLSDAWTLFQKAVMDAGVFDFLKSELQAVLARINELSASGELKRWAQEAGDAIVGILERAKVTLGWLYENRDLFVSFGEGVVTAFEIIEIAFISLMDAIGTGWIEIKNAGSLAWGLLQDAAGKALAAILTGFAKMAEGVAKVYNAIGEYDLAGPATRAAIATKALVRDINNWSTNLEKANAVREQELKTHNDIIASIIDERASYKNLAKDTQKAQDDMAKAMKEREAKTVDALKNIEKAEAKKTTAVKKLTKQEVKAQEKAEQDRLKAIEQATREAEKLREQELKDFEKQLDSGRQAFEGFIESQLEIKSISNESMAELDRVYSEIFRDAKLGDEEAFDLSLAEMLTSKEFQLEELKKYDDLYSVYLREKTAADAETRQEFYRTANVKSDEWLAHETANIEAMSAKFASAGADAVEVEKWKTAEIEKLNLDKLKSNDDFVSGMRAALQESQNDLTTWADVGRTTYQAFESGLAESFSSLINFAIKGDLDNLKSSWDSVLDSMLGKVVDILAQMAAEWAAAGIAKAATAGIQWLSAETGAFDVGRTGPGEMVDGAIPALLHAGETVLPAEWTDAIKEATNFDEWKQSISDFFGFSDNPESSSLLSDVSEYGSTGASLFRAYQAFAEGDEVAGVVEAMNALSEAFTTYGEQNANALASQIGQGLGEAAGVIGSGYSAYQAYESEQYVQAVVNALNAIQSGVALYGTVTGTTIGAAGTAAGAVLSTASSAVGGAGYGLAAWNLLTWLAGNPEMASDQAQWGAAIGGAIVGALVEPEAGPVGALIGGIFGTGISSSRRDRFDLSDWDATINAERTVENGRLGYLTVPPEGGATQNAYRVYLEQLNLQADAVNALADKITGDMDAGQREQFNSMLSDRLGAKLSRYESGGDFLVDKGAEYASRVSAYYWNETLDAMQSAVTEAKHLGMLSDEDFVSYSEMMLRTKPNSELIYNPFNPRLSPEYVRQQSAFQAAQEEHRRHEGLTTTITPQGRWAEGAQTGGVVVPGSEDGMLSVQVGEGIIPLPGMEWLEKLGKQFFRDDSLGPFGGEFAGVVRETVQPVADAAIDAKTRVPDVVVNMPGIDIPEYPQQMTESAIMQELLLHDAVSKLFNINQSVQNNTTTISEAVASVEVTNNAGFEKLLQALWEIARLQNGVLERIASKTTRITATEIVDLIDAELANRATTGRLDLTNPIVTQMAQQYFREPRQGMPSGWGPQGW